MSLLTLQPGCFCGRLRGDHLSVSRSMTTRKEVAVASRQWITHCDKIDTPAQNAIRQLQANTTGRQYRTMLFSTCLAQCNALSAISLAGRQFARTDGASSLALGKC